MAIEGAPAPQGPRKSTGTGVIVAVIVVIFLAIFVVLFMRHSAGSAPKSSTTSNQLAPQ